MSNRHHGVALSVALLLFACQPTESLPRMPPARRARPAASATPNAASTHAESSPSRSNRPAGFEIQDAGGDRAFQIVWNGTAVKVAFPADGQSATIEGLHSFGRRKYLQNGAVIAEVKPTESLGFEVLSPDGTRLYWKIKREGDNIKISDNPQNDQRYELNSKGDRIEVLGPGGKALGVVRIDTASHRSIAEDASGKVQFSIASGRADHCLGVALIKDIPVARRAVIMAELVFLDQMLNHMIR